MLKGIRGEMGSSGRKYIGVRRRPLKRNDGRTKQARARKAKVAKMVPPSNFAVEHALLLKRVLSSCTVNGRIDRAKLEQKLRNPSLAILGYAPFQQ